MRDRPVGTQCRRFCVCARGRPAATGLFYKNLLIITVGRQQEDLPYSLNSCISKLGFRVVLWGLSYINSGVSHTQLPIPFAPSASCPSPWPCLPGNSWPPPPSPPPAVVYAQGVQARVLLRMEGASCCISQLQSGRRVAVTPLRRPLPGVCLHFWGFAGTSGASAASRYTVMCCMHDVRDASHMRHCSRDGLHHNTRLRFCSLVPNWFHVQCGPAQCKCCPPRPPA